MFITATDDGGSFFIT